MTHEQFTQIYLPFSGKMYALAYNLLRNRDEARDCVQDVYSELWIKRDTIEPDPLPFVLTMVRNNCLDRLKSRSAQADDETLETLLDHNTENQIDAASDLNAVIQLIDKLPSDQQIIIRLRTIDGLEIEQIQELTHFSRENIYTLLSRARKGKRHRMKNGCWLRISVVRMCRKSYKRTSNYSLCLRRSPTKKCRKTSPKK